MIDGNAFGYPQQFGGGLNPDWSMSMAGPSGFAGQMPQLGGGMFGAPPQQQQHKHGGMNPMLAMGLMGLLGGGLLSGGGFKGLAGGMISPLGFGLHKLGAF